MKRRGPPPLPTRLKVLTGNPGKRPLNRAEPKPAPELPVMPPFLRLPLGRAAQAAREEWERIAGDLVGLGILTKIDRAVFIAYCVLYGQWVAAIEKILVTGAIVRAGKTGVPMQSPHVSIARHALRHWIELAGELGIGAASRSRVTRAEAAPGDDDQDLLG